MKIKYLLIPIFVGLLALTASAQTTPLSADITSPSNGTSVTVGQSISFQSQASGGAGLYNYIWNFGDSAAGAGENFSKAYAVAGSYRVTVTVSDIQDNQASDSIDITVVNQPSNLPTVDLTINDSSIDTGATATLSWTSTNATSCTASQDWTGNKSTSGTESVGPFTTATTKTYTVTCINAASQPVSDTVTLTVASVGGGTKPVISNIRVTDITETSAIVRWTTDRNANSRVIYDTTSHPSITGASFPNFGYANSSATQDDSTKVTEHAVTLTSLSANTAYYFRVLSQ